MIINLIRSTRLFSLNLPEKINGQFWLMDEDEKGKRRNLISVEAHDGKWLIKENDRISILAPNQTRNDGVYLYPLCFYQVTYKDSNDRAFLFAENDDIGALISQKYAPSDRSRITIGRTKENTICYSNQYISQNHATLTFDGKKWAVVDNNSANGTFVNGKKIKTSNLNAGDLIYIMGLRIVVGQGFISINQPGNSVQVRSEQLGRLALKPFMMKKIPTENKEKGFFFRSPRFYREVEHVEIKVDAPPAAQKVDEIPMALMIGPSLTMSVASLSTSFVTLNSAITSGYGIASTIPTLMMSASMLLGAVLWPVLTKNHERKEKSILEKRRQEKYLLYLNEVRDEIKKLSKEQSEILYESMVSLEECEERIALKKPTLWERVNGQSDFLKLRLGTGQMPVDINLQISEKRFTMEDDSLQGAMLSLNSESQKMIKVPISVSLTEKQAVGLFGNIDLAKNAVKALILQMIALHSYDELKIMLITDENEREWSFVRFIPHFWSDDRSVRFFATNEDEMKELSAYIEKSILSRKEQRANQYFELSPYYVIISIGSSLSSQSKAINDLLRSSDGVLGASVIFATLAMNNLPKETKTIISLESRISKLYDRDDTAGREIAFDPDYINENIIDAIARDIAKIELDIQAQRYTLPHMLTFLDMFGVGKVEHLNALTRWKQSNPTMSLQTVVGVDINGAPFYLDLHEKYHGPHGLIAGMTGSGKSEFIITYILSLAVNYHPDEVAFILIDYKGGGLTGAFEDSERGIHLPHLAGTITNLDGAAINRSLVSIQSELRRRQAVFNEARKKSNEGTMDIYKYQQLYRAKVVSEPVPHLFVISDEFAELKSQQPEFMEQLISAARIGRSLGVHLILATQKPSGVVDDQIWSNSRFRVCLKVQSKADSQEMIRCPDAAELSQTGRFYLQVGYNELFALGQSAWSGAEYYPQDVYEKEQDNSIRVVDHLGRTLMDVMPAQNKTVKSTTKQIVSVVSYLSELAKGEGIHSRKLWLDPIPDKIYIDELEKKYAYRSKAFELSPVIGEYDDPFNQKQKLLCVPLTQDGNCLVYGFTGNGKTTFITALCYSLLRNHSAEELNLYIMDFGSETLKAFEDAPQVGGVVVSTDEEKTVNLLKLLDAEIKERKKKFADFGGGFTEYCEKKKDCPNIVVAINNFSGFAEQYEDYLDTFALLCRDGVKFGIYFVVSASNTNAVRYRIQQSFKTMYALQMNDPMDYTMIVGRTDGLVPSKHKGRGLMAADKVYEFQTAYCSRQRDSAEFLRTFCRSLRKESKTMAKPIPQLPERVDFACVQDALDDLKKVPVGIYRKSLKPAVANIGNAVVFPVIAPQSELLIGIAEEFCTVISSIAQTQIIDADQVLETKRNNLVRQGFDEWLKDVFAQTVLRHNEYVDSGKDMRSMEKYPEKVYVILGMRKLLDRLSDDAKDRMQTLLEKCIPEYKLHFVLLDSISNAAGYIFDDWYKLHAFNADGVWIGNGIAEQDAIRIGKTTSELYEDIDPAFGYFVCGGKPYLIKYLSSRYEEETNE